MATESKLFTAVADPGPLTASPRLKRFAMGMAAAGFLLFVLALATSPQRAWAAFLVNYFFFLCIGLGVFSSPPCSTSQAPFGRFLCAG